ncbi:MAG: GldG family protein, partial [Burkholderiales bacterium]
RALQGIRHYSVSILILSAALGAAAYFASHHATQWDVTQNMRNTLTDATLDVLRQLPGPILVTAYANAKLGELRKSIAEFVARYQRVKPDISLRFVDPEREPGAARAAGIKLNGEMVVRYGRRSENLTQLNEPALTRILLRLAHTRERQVFYLDGHGERRLDGVANHDLGDFGARLTAQGFKISALNVALAQDVPRNAAMLLIASPQVDLLPGEVEKLRRYLEKGGNLLWLIDQEPLRGLQPLVELLRLELGPGIVVDPAAQELKLPATWAVAAPEEIHSATRSIKLNAVFPNTRQIAVTEDSGWNVLPLINVAQRGWVETGEPGPTLRFDPQQDMRGPITIGVSLSREQQDREQRVVVIGGGDFLANTYLGNGGNLDLGVAVVNWLVGDEHLIGLQPRATPDHQLRLSRGAAAIISIGSLIVLPLLLFATGAVIWWRRRRL